jgi:hypothetical protein
VDDESIPESLKTVIRVFPITFNTDPTNKVLVKFM